MGQLFQRSANTLARLTIFGGVFIVVGALWLGITLMRSPYVNGAGVTRQQPVPFSHKHHVKGLGIDCRHCHTSVEESAFAGLPATKTCYTCHSQVWGDAPMLEPVRTSFRDDRSIEWTRVHDLPDFAYFNHSIHVAKGVGCVSCHGQVDEMPLMRQQNSLQMEWCLDCHRHPAPNIRPKEEVFNMNWQPPDDPAERVSLAERLVAEYGVRSVTDCSACHR